MYVVNLKFKTQIWKLGPDLIMKNLEPWKLVCIQLTLGPCVTLHLVQGKSRLRSRFVFMKLCTYRIFGLHEFFHLTQKDPGFREGFFVEKWCPLSKIHGMQGVGRILYSLFHILKVLDHSTVYS